MKLNPSLNLKPIFTLPVRHQQPSNVSDPDILAFTIIPHMGGKKAHQLPIRKCENWSNLQKQRYSIFVCYFRQILKQMSQNDSNWNIFKAMSKFIQSRSPQQCRSYHLKLLKEFHTIGTYIKVAMKRLHSLKERIIASEDQLNRLQMEFNLFIEEKKQMQNVLVQRAIEKRESKVLPKTADSYIQEQNPVNQYHANLNYPYLGNYSQQQPFFGGFKPISKNHNKASLPSFADEEGQVQDQKKAAKQPQQFNLKLHERKYQSSFLQQEWKISNQNQFLSHQKQYHFDFINHQQPINHSNLFNHNSTFKPFPSFVQNSQPVSYDSTKQLQKMKEILECHYLFQLWTSKLEKIMRD